MKVVLDTNVLLVALPPHSADHLILLELMRGSFDLCLTTDILLEYEEIFAKKASPQAARFALELLDVLPNVHQIRKYFFFQLLETDPDENKFVDCALAAEADFLVTDDHHFNALRPDDFPFLTVVKKAVFLEILKMGFPK